MGLFGRQSKRNRQMQKSYVPPADVSPVCPHCERPLDGVFTQEIANTFGKTWLYFCVDCKKVLGVSQRKGFWMG